ncbi:hypothetical protein E4T56_gene19005 [Termitomyces sp. T112]|nr:hypothetical protein E4T56_gene19005 [Termitomyces sp. T112]
MTSLSSSTFSDKDILNCDLRPSDSSSMLIKISTTVGSILRLPKTTTLVPIISYSSPHFPISTIYWKHHEFEIDGSRRKWYTLNYKPKLFSSTREWQWSPAHNSYVVKYKEHRWTAAPTHSRDSVVATLTPYKKHFLSELEPAILSLSPSLPAVEKAFLMLVMIYSERRRLEEKKEVRS